MKRTVAWHEKCLQNHLDSLNRDTAYVRQMEERLEESRRQFHALRLQIARAKAEGKDSFDRERYKP